MSDGRCAAQLEALVERGIEAWSGLPRGCVPAELEPVLTTSGEPGMWNLGLRKAFFRSGTFQGAPAQVWTTTDDAEVLLIDVEDPPFAARPDLVRERLGPPELQLDTARGSIPLPGGEWVYPQRGLAVFVDLDDQVWRAALFPACSPDEYESDFRVLPSARRQPLR